MFENLNLKEMYDNPKKWWPNNYYRFYKNNISFERQTIINFDSKNNFVKVKDLYTGKVDEFFEFFNRPMSIIEDNGDYFLLVKEDFSVVYNYELYRLDMDIEKINKLKLEIVI